MKSEISDSRKSSSTGNIFRLNTPGFCQEEAAHNKRDISVDVGSAEAEQLFKQSSALSGLFFLLFDFSRPLKIVLSLALVGVMVGGLLNYLSSTDYSYLNFAKPNNDAELVNLAALMAPAAGDKASVEVTASEHTYADHKNETTVTNLFELSNPTPADVNPETQLLSNEDIGFQMVVAADIANHQYVLDLPIIQEIQSSIVLGNNNPINRHQENSAIASSETERGSAIADKSSTVPAGLETNLLATSQLVEPAIQINENQANVERKLIERSKQLTRQGRLTQAQVELGAGLIRLPESTPILLELNRLFIKSKKWSTANELLAANSWLPKTALAQGTAELFYAKGEFTKAMSVLEGLNPDVVGNESFYLLKASVLRKLKKFSAAEVIYRQLLSHDPRKGSYWLGLAVCQDFTADPTAFNSYAQALKYNRGYPKVVAYIQSRMKILNVFRSKTAIAKQGF